MVERKLVRLGAHRLVVKQRLHVPGDGGERGAQLVGHVGDKVSLGAFHLFDASDVVQHGHGAAAGHRRGVYLVAAAGYERGRFAHRHGAVFEREADAFEHVGIADGLDERMADPHCAAHRWRTGQGYGRGDVISARKQPLHAFIGPLDSAGGVDRDDGVLHAVEQCFELAAAFGGLAERALDLFGG